MTCFPFGGLHAKIIAILNKKISLTENIHSLSLTALKEQNIKII